MRIQTTVKKTPPLFLKKYIYIYILIKGRNPFKPSLTSAHMNALVRLDSFLYYWCAGDLMLMLLAASGLVAVLAAFIEYIVPPPQDEEEKGNDDDDDNDEVVPDPQEDGDAASEEEDEEVYAPSSQAKKARFRDKLGIARRRSSRIAAKENKEDDGN